VRKEPRKTPRRDADRAATGRALEQDADDELHVPQSGVVVTATVEAVAGAAAGAAIGAMVSPAGIAAGAAIGGAIGAMAAVAAEGQARAVRAHGAWLDREIGLTSGNLGEVRPEEWGPDPRPPEARPDPSMERTLPGLGPDPSKR